MDFKVEWGETKMSRIIKIKDGMSDAYVWGNNREYKSKEAREINHLIDTMRKRNMFYMFIVPPHR